MANLYNWRFFQDTSLEGGVVAANNVYYIDSYNGSDVSGDGTHTNPLATIQKAIDIGSTYVDCICAGYFKEGEFMGGSRLGIIAEGNAIIEGSDNIAFGTIDATYFNSRTSGGGIYNYGRVTIQNYTSVGSSVVFQSYNTTFLNCLNIATKSSSTLNGFGNNFVMNANLGLYVTTVGTKLGYSSNVIENNTFLNVTIGGYGISNFMVMQNNYFDANCKFEVYRTAGPFTVFDNGSFNYNHWEGTLPNKMGGPFGAYYDNIEALQIGEPTLAVNDIASTVSPLFNDPSNDDYTLQEASPLSKAASDKGPIGAFNVANIGETNSNSAKFDYVNINTTTSGEITLSTDGVGTATTKPLYHHQIAPKKRLITKTIAPNLEQNFGLGETMSSDLNTATVVDGLDTLYTPARTDIEIQYTTDTGVLVDGAVGSDDNYNGTWLKVPIGEAPLHDTVNDVGNADHKFDINNSVPISSKYVKMKITLRSDETPLT